MKNKRMSPHVQATCSKQFSCFQYHVTLKVIVWTLWIVLVGIGFSHYDSTFKANHQLCLSILKQLGLGRRVIETRILMEVEKMTEKVREKQGRSFDVKQLVTSCVANVIMNMLFGHPFDHSDLSFQQVISNIHERFTDYSFAIELFPALRILPSFKKMITTILRTWKVLRIFVCNNIAACSQVCTVSLPNKICCWPM